MQEIEVLYKSGNIDTFSPTCLSAENGEGFSVDNVFLNVSNLEKYGLRLIRTAWSFNECDNAYIMLNDDKKTNAITLIAPDALSDVLYIKVDGDYLLVRGEVLAGKFVPDADAQLLNLKTQCFGISHTFDI